MTVVGCPRRAKVAARRHHTFSIAPLGAGGGGLNGPNTMLMCIERMPPDPELDREVVGYASGPTAVVPVVTLPRLLELNRNG
jgi:hypothetical protein